MRQVWYTCTSVFLLSMLFCHTLFASICMVIAAFPMHLLISTSRDRLLVMVDLRKVNSSDIWIFRDLLAYGITFFGPTVRPHPVQA